MIHSKSDCIYHTSISDPDYSAISLLPWIPDNNPLFDLKNEDIGPKSGPKLNMHSTISETWLGDPSNKKSELGNHEEGSSDL